MIRSEDYLRGVHFLYKLSNSSIVDDFSYAGNAIWDLLEVKLPIEEIDEEEIEALGRVINEAATWKFRAGEKP